MRRYLLILSAVVLCGQMFAAHRSVEEARMEALQWGIPGVNGQRVAAKPAELRLASIYLTEAGEPAMYVFNRGQQDGFVIISADDRAHTVLGYADQGHWDEESMPSVVLAWIDNYTHAIEYISQTDAAPGIDLGKTYTPVAPLVATKWGQGTPYNNLCPTWQGKHCLTGCVATAYSQIMRTHNHPNRGVGSNSYKWANENGDSLVLSADFGNTTYDWGAGFDTAKLMYHCGVACEMEYGPKNSTSTSDGMARALIEHFRYDKSIHQLRLNYIPEPQLVDSIYADLRQNRPVVVSGATVAGGGHSFVCDGIDANGMLHINWGWKGKSDAYYRLSALLPSHRGEGGAAYTERVKVFTHIHPDANGSYFYSFCCDSIHVSQTGYSKDEMVHFRIDTMRNDAFVAWTGNLALRVYKDGAFYRDRTTETDLKPLASGYRRNKITYEASFEDFPAGTYEVEMMARATDQQGKRFPVMCKWLGHWRCTLTVTDDSIFVRVPDIPEPAETPLPFTPAEQKHSYKIIRNGMIYIVHDGVTYTMQGLRKEDE